MVEDDPLSMRLWSVILENAGHQVSAATNFQEALDRLGERIPDLVISDVQFPGGGGELLLDEIRKNPATKSLPVLVATAHAMQGDSQRLLARGFDAYMSKPIDQRRLPGLIESMLAGG